MKESEALYSYHCKNCGYTFMSDSKDAVRNAGKTHKVVTVRRDTRFRHCPLVPLNKELTQWSRRDLAEKLLEAK